MRRLFQPFLTFVRWSICHFEFGVIFTKKYKNALLCRRISKARSRLQKEGWRILELVEEICGAQNVEHYCEYGTLLGMVREGGFITHDDDVDFGMPPDVAFSRKMFDAMRAKGFKFKRAFVWSGIMTEIAFDFKGVPVDFFFTFEAGGKIYGQTYNNFVQEDGGYWAKQVCRFFKPAYKGVKKISLNGVSVSIPQNAEDYLLANYGSNWRTPIEGFKADGAEMKRQYFDGRAEIVTDPKAVMPLLPDSP